MSLSFADAVARVSSLQNRGWRLGLDRMNELVRRLEIQHWPKFVHVAGTNGKGSVTAFVQSILAEQGWSVGGYYSPYVYNVRERIQYVPASEPGVARSSALGKALISEHDFAELVEAVWPVAESLEPTPLGGPTEFEFKTAMGFKYWSEKRCDFVALEVGLGGRLDATNVVDPACSVIVNIGMDHTEILGDTLAEIAIEKAGIVKPDRPVVVGELPEEAWLAVETIAKAANAPVWKLGRDIIVSTGFDGYRVTTPGGTYERLTPGIEGVVQPHNMAIAVAAVEAAGGIRTSRLVGRGVAKASAPGRMQWARHRGHQFLLDGAHNADASRVLVENLRSRPQPPGKVVLLTGMLEGHKPGEFYEPLSEVVDEAHFVPIAFHRSRQPEQLASEAGWLFERSFSHESVMEGLSACLDSGADLVLVTGSFYLVGEVGRFLGLG